MNLKLDASLLDVEAVTDGLSQLPNCTSSGAGISTADDEICRTRWAFKIIRKKVINIYQYTFKFLKCHTLEPSLTDLKIYVMMTTSRLLT